VLLLATLGSSRCQITYQLTSISGQVQNQIVLLAVQYYFYLYLAILQHSVHPNKFHHSTAIIAQAPHQSLSQG